MSKSRASRGKPPSLFQSDRAISVHLAAENAALVAELCKIIHEVHKATKFAVTSGKDADFAAGICLERARLG